MKKFIILILSLVSGFFLFAESYEVSTVIGKVYTQTESGKWKAIREGSILKDEMTVRIEENSSVGILISGKRVIFRGPKNETLENLMASRRSGTGVAHGSQLKQSAVARSKDKVTKGVSTAASRASESQGDTAWSEGEGEKENE